LSSWQMAEDEAELVLEPDEASAEVSKKKKKKKKKTSASAETAEGEEPAAAPPAQVQPAPDAQEKYLAVLEALRSGDETACWASLSACNIGDKKARKLAEALKQTVSQKVDCALTSIDLSHNLISDAGAAALTAALQSRDVAPRLLQFSLAGNPLSPEGCDACEQALTARSDLTLSVRAEAGGANGGGGGGAVAELLNSYFVGHDEEAAPTFEGATELLVALGAGEPCRAAHVAAVELLAAAADSEAAEAAGNNPKVLPRALRWCSKNVGVLQKLLACPSATELPQRDPARERVGLHRLHTISVLHALVRARRGALTGALLDAKPCVLGRAVDLMIGHPSSPILGTAVLGLAADVLGGPSKPLRLGLLDEPPGAPPARVAALAQAVLSPLGAQAISRGRFLELTSQLRQASADDKQLALKLSTEPRWAELIGALPRLRASLLEGQLCGPPPPRPAAPGGGPMGEEASLIAMLQKMGIDGPGIVTG